MAQSWLLSIKGKPPANCKQAEARIGGLKVLHWEA